MGAHKLSWATIVLLLLPFIGILIVVLQRWIESREEPVAEKPVEFAHATEEHGHGKADAEAVPAPEAITAEAAPAPEAIAAEAVPAPETITAEAVPAPEAIAAEAAPAPEAFVVEDDLEIIEGIGPKIASVLREAGITSFVRLAQAKPDELREVLKAAGVRVASTETWPEQARLASEGRWEELRAYQDRLKGGRLIS